MSNECQPPSTVVDGAVVKKPSVTSLVLDVLRSSWRPANITMPVVDPNLDEMSVLERIAEVCRYKLLQLEYSLSSGGGLRAWIRLNLLVSIVLGIPALFVVPIVTWLLGSFVTWTAFILQASLNLLYTLLTIIAIVFTAIAAILALKAILKAQMENKRRRR